MPSATEYVPPTEQARGDFNTALNNEIQSRRNKYKLALDYYMGEQDYPFPNDEETGSYDATVVNLVKMTADRTAEFLFSDMPKFELNPETPEDTPEEAWIKEFFKANGGLTTMAKLALRGFLSGHCFVQVKPVPESKRKSKRPQYPQILILDPTSVSVYWRADDVGDVLWYEKRYYVNDIMYIQDFVKDGDTWKILTYRSVQAEINMWDGVPTLHGGLWNINFRSTSFVSGAKPAVHASEIAPIIEWPHLPHPDDRYGIGEFTNKSLQDTINRIASARNRIVSENSSPTDILLGADIAEIKDDGDIIAIANPSAKVQRLEMKGDLTAISTVLKETIEIYLAIARVVLLKGEAKDLQRVTNASVRTLFLDMLAKNNLLQYAYGEGLISIVYLALEMAFGMGAVFNGVKLKNPIDLNVRIKWASPLPTDMTELANVLAIFKSMGAVSSRTASTEGGYDWTFEHAAMTSEREATMEQAREDMGMQAEFAPEPDVEATSEPHAQGSKTAKENPLDKNPKQE